MGRRNALTACWEAPLVWPCEALGGDEAGRRSSRAATAAELPLRTNLAATLRAVHGFDEGS
jgi:hypothetical protein